MMRLAKRSCPPGRDFRQPGGLTLVELMITAGVMMALAASAVPLLKPAIANARARGAARYVGMRLQQARWEAVKRATHVGFRFDPAAGYRFAMHVDGNRNGLRTADISSGVDPMLGSPERLEERYQGVRFGVLEGTVAVESDEVLTSSSDPIRLGSTDILSFGPLGTATSGTIYLHGDGGEQYAVRVLGGTGRVRVLRYRLATGVWGPP